MIGLEKYQKDIVRAAYEFARGEFDLEKALTFDTEQIFPREVLKKAGELGFLGVHVPEEYGGGGMDYFDTVLVSETFAANDSTYGISMTYSLFGPEAIFLFGSEDQKKRFLPPALKGEEIISSSLTFMYSPQANNIESISKKGKGFVIEGELQYVPYATDANWLVFGLDRMEFDKKTGKVIFIIPLTLNKIEILPQGRGLGWNMIPFFRVRLNGVEVGENDYLGKGFFSIGEIKRFVVTNMVLIGSLGVGIAQGAFNRAIEHVKVREQFNKRLIQFPVVRDKLSEMVVKVRGARCLTYESAKMISLKKGKSSGKIFKKILVSALSAKMFSARTAKEVSDEAIQLLGGYGYMKEYHVERFYRDAKCLELLVGDVNKIREMILQETI